MISSTTNVFDLTGNLTSTTDGDGNNTVMTYDALGNVLTQNFYAANGTLISTASYAYDLAGNLTTMTDGDGNTTVMTYDALGNVLTENFYDASGTLISSTTNAYDLAGNLTSTIDGDGNVTTLTYDANGNVLMQITKDPSGNVISSYVNTYDLAGNLLTTTNGVGDVTVNTWNGNQLASTSVGYGTAAAATTSYAYDLAGNQTSETDPDGNTTVYTYNANGQVLTTTNALGAVTTNTYDLAGNLASTTDADGRTITYAYSGNQLITETWFNADGSVQDVLNYTYDLAGNVLTASNSAGTYTMTYVGNQLATETDPNGLTLTYTYDLAGNVTSIADSQGGLTTMVYAGNQVVTKTYQDSITQLRVDYTYDLNGNILTETRYSDLAGTQLQGTTQNTYDGNEITSIVQTDGNGNVLASYSYVYNAAQELTSETDDGVTTDYGYNASGELIIAGNTTYTYDANGNPTGSGYVIGPNNELLSDGTNNYTYDANGNLLTQTNISTGVTWTYGYNDANQQISAVETDANGNVLEQISYTYDVFGNRIAETVTTASGTAAERFAYDANNTLYAELNASDTIQTRFVADVNGPNTWVAQVSAPGSAWLLGDHLGSTRLVVSLTGGVDDQLSYDAFGNLTSQTNSLQGSILMFQGGVYDSATQSYVFGAREYNPQTGEWDEQDPTGLGPDSNPYRFVGNAPTDATDPAGMYLIVDARNPNKALILKLVKQRLQEDLALIAPAAKLFGLDISNTLDALNYQDLGGNRLGIDIPVRVSEFLLRLIRHVELNSRKDVDGAAWSNLLRIAASPKENVELDAGPDGKSLIVRRENDIPTNSEIIWEAARGAIKKGVAPAYTVQGFLRGVKKEISEWSNAADQGRLGEKTKQVTARGAYGPLNSITDFFTLIGNLPRVVTTVATTNPADTYEGLFLHLGEKAENDVVGTTTGLLFEALAAKGLGKFSKEVVADVKAALPPKAPPVNPKAAPGNPALEKPAPKGEGHATGAEPPGRPNCAFPHSGCISSRTLPNCHPICGRCLHREFGKRRYLAPRSRMIYRTPLPRSSPRRYNGDFSGGPPVGDQCWFSRDDGEWNAIAERLKQTPCPHCSRVGPLIRHGFLYGFDDSNPTGKTRRAHRVFCSNRNARPGCGRTFTVWLADKIRRLSLTTTALWQFLQRAAANGILDAIRARDGQRSDRTWQRVWKRFNLCQSKIRTALFGRCPPPDLPPQPPQRPAAQVVAHLQAAFPDSHCPITAFQHSLRTFFV